MRRKIKHVKRYKSYPKNVPKKLLKLFFDLDCSVTKLSTAVDLNSGIISALLNDGVEPKDSLKRMKLFLSAHAVCKLCNRRIFPKRSTANKAKPPEFITRWKHLPADERQKVIKQYLDWKERKK